jgi:hypothetical protein
MERSDTLIRGGQILGTILDNRILVIFRFIRRCTIFKKEPGYGIITQFGRNRIKG